VMPLVDELASPDAGVRNHAVIALKAVGDDRMFPLAISMARDANPIFRVYALEAFSYLYDQRFQNMPVDMLHDSNPAVRYYALRCVEMNRITASMSTVRTMASSDGSYRVREKAIGILTAYRDGSSLYIFIKAISDREPSVRLAAANGLYWLNSRSSAQAVSNQLITETDEQIKELLLGTLIRLGSAGTMRGIEKSLLEDANPLIRALAACALGESRERRAVDSLVPALADKDMRVRAEACNALGFYREKKSMDELVRISVSTDDRYVRSAALYALKRIADRAAVKAVQDHGAMEKDPVIKSIIDAMR
jgi:HEAT repeat protein